MTCRAVEPSLSPMLDGELAPAAEAAVRRHLETCASCLGTWRLLALVRNEVAALEPEEVGADFDARLDRRMRKEARAGRRSERAWRVASWIGWSAAAAVAVVAVTVARRPGTIEPSARPTPSPPTTAAVPWPKPEAPARVPPAIEAAPRPVARRPRPTASAVALPDDAREEDAWPARPGAWPGDSPGWHAGQPEPVRIADVGAASEPWRGGRSRELQTFEERVAAEARRAVGTSEDSWREQ